MATPVLTPSLQNNAASRKSMALYCRVDRASVITNLLSTIQTSGKQLANILAIDTGLKVSVESGKTFQANAFLQKELFEEYHILEPVAFSVPLNTLMDCLSIFGTNIISYVPTEVHIMYRGYGHKLCIV